MPERNSKLCSLAEAAARVPDGCRVTFGGFAVYQKPMALVRELVRQERRGLTVVGVVNSLDVDMLVGAGCVRCVETSYVGLEKYGLAPNFRRAVQRGDIQIVHYPEMLSWDRFRADREGFPYWPVYYLGGNDVVKENPDIVEYTCPVSGRPVWALPAAKPDFVLIHAWRADKYGNVQIQPRHMLPQYQDIDLARACGNVIVTVEEIVDTAEIEKTPQLTMLPSFKVSCVAHVPKGSHPTSTLLCREEDGAHFAAYAKAAAADDTFAAYLDRFVRGTADEDAYQAAVAAEKEAAQ